MNLNATFTVATLLTATVAVSPAADLRPENLSLKLEVERAIQRGNSALLKLQDPETGIWGDAIYPALTALPLTAIMGDPTREAGPLPPSVEAAYAYLAKIQKSDGGIYGKGLGVYNTSLSVMALLAYDDRSKVQDSLASARRFLMNQQSDFDRRGKADNPFDGGVGYGGTYSHSDLSNTHFALEALHYSRDLVSDGDTPDGDTFDLDWEAAISFVSRCQNLTATNDQPWASDDPANKGGFVYFPGDSKAGEQELGGGRVALRSYGSMSYAGLLSLIYAKLDPSDQRIVAVLDWLKKNYTLEENPGLDGQGLFYYYHTMAKALRILGIDELKLADGTKVDWRKDLSTKLMDLQQPDGSFINTTGRWWENDPVLVTAYAVLTLEHIHRAL